MKKNVTLVLSGGGARGYAHIGAIEEIESQGMSSALLPAPRWGLWLAGFMLPVN